MADSNAPQEGADSEQSFDSMLSKLKDNQPPPPEEAAKYQSHVDALTSSQKQAADLQTQASNATDPSRRKSLMAKAADHHMKFITENEKLRKLEKGWQQGAVAGGGAGIATGMGLGGIVGTLAGGLVSIPTGLVGAGVGTGVGAVKGPFWEVPKKKEEQGKNKE